MFWFLTPSSSKKLTALKPCIMLLKEKGGDKNQIIMFAFENVMETPQNLMNVSISVIQ